MLGGGLGAWIGPQRSGSESAAPRSFEPRPADDTIAAEELLERIGDPGLTVVDVRAPERYRGEVEPLDPVAGHIPGAVNVPFDGELALGPELLEADEIAVYCGSGVTACVVLLALARQGRADARLYPGSWSEWVSRELPVAPRPG